MQKLKIVIIGILLIGLVMGYFLYLSNKTQGIHATKTPTEKNMDDSKERIGDEGYEQEISNLIGKDLEREYPATPAAVLKFFGRIQVCYYNSKCSEDQLSKLADQARMLFSKELLEDNPKETYLSNLKGEIKRYQEDEKTIVNLSVEDPEGIEKKTINEIEYAQAEVVYYLQTKGAYSELTEIYMLKQNSEGQWKIVGWTREDED